MSQILYTKFLYLVQEGIIWLQLKIVANLSLNWSWSSSRTTWEFWKLAFSFAILHYTKQCQATTRFGLGRQKCILQQMVNGWICSIKMDAILVHDVNLIKDCIQLFRNKWVTVHILVETKGIRNSRSRTWKLQKKLKWTV